MIRSEYNKIPEITFFFWLAKIAATTLGETAGDLFSMTLNMGYATSCIMLISIFLVSLVAQMTARKFNPILYWFVILTTSTAGTTMSDYMDRTLELGYMKGSLLLISILCAVLVTWRITLGSLSVNNIRGFKMEIFYWMAILFSNTLGTALGDFLADDSGLGFGGGAILLGGLIGLIALAYYFTRLSHVFLFWAAFVLTRPFGATFGDLLSKSTEKGGLDFGTIGTSGVLAILLIIFVVISVVAQPTGKRIGQEV